MPKRRLKLKVRIPPYQKPKNEWRREIHEASLDAAKDAGIEYRDDDRLELDLKLYLHEKALEIHDVDNRLKDVMDALQGKAGGPKNIQKLKPIIPNDNQIFKVAIEKLYPPKQSHAAGHLTIRQYKA